MSATEAQGPTTEGSTQLRWIAPGAPKTRGPAPRNLTNLHPSSYRDDERARRIRLWDNLNSHFVLLKNPASPMLRDVVKGLE